jgi:AcrR family transcriptional regulator
MDPRVTRSRDAVLRATRDLLAEVGFAGLSIDAIARRSGVARTTIYRHWDSLADLLVDAGASVGCYEPPQPTDDPIEDLRTILWGIRDALAGEWGDVLPSLVDAAARDRHLRSLVHARVRERRGPTIRAVERLVEAGDLPIGTDAEALADRLVAPLFYRHLISQRRTTDTYLDELLTETLLGAGLTRAAGST